MGFCLRIAGILQEGEAFLVKDCSKASFVERLDLTRNGKLLYARAFLPLCAFVVDDGVIDYLILPNGPCIYFSGDKLQTPSSHASGFDTRRDILYNV